MKLFLVRHAHAGDRSRWNGPDDLRPLTKRGARQAEALAARLGGQPIRRILSSPSLRCVQTVVPLARVLGLQVEDEETVYEGADPAQALGRLRELAAETAVVCSHGDVIASVISQLALSGAVRGEQRWAKGSTWVLEGSSNRFLGASYLPPGD